MFEPQGVCCFSGYRPEKFDVSQEAPAALYHRICALLDRAVENAVFDGYTRFLTGMSRGFDIWAAQSVLRLQADHPEIRLVCCLPHPAQSAEWTPIWQELHGRILQQADMTFCISDSQAKGCYLERNRFMVQNARRLICWYDGRPGGTQYTVRHAEAHGLSVVNLAEW